MSKQIRTIRNIVKARAYEEGEGFLVHQPLPYPGATQVDPFLLIHEMGPRDLKPGEAKGAPDHPHRGFETVTYMISGELVHQDSAGHQGDLGPGDVQWMTAGAGVVHSEMPSARMLEKGGRMHGFQLWVNLPSERKMTEPHYQDIRGKMLPSYIAPGVEVRVIAGELQCPHSLIHGPAETIVPTAVWDVILKPGAEFEAPLPDGWNALAYVYDGYALIGPEAHSAQNIPAQTMAVFEGNGSIKLIAPKDRSCRVLVLAGAPIGEPVARFGPFVMNTRKELEQAFWDYQSGRMGHIRKKAI